MTLSTVSSSRLHCCLVVLILFILIFLSLPLLLIYVANTRYVERENSKPIDKSGSLKCATQLVPQQCIQRPANNRSYGSLMTIPPSSSIETLSSSLSTDNVAAATTTTAIDNNRPTINYCNETSLQANQSPSNEYRKYLIKLDVEAGG